MPVTLAAVQAGAGLVQGAVGFFEGRKARKEMERLKTPTYTPSKSILDYYNTALGRSREDPYQSNFYKQQANQIQRSTAQGLSSLNDRRMALAGVNSLVQGQNDALARTGLQAEQEQSRRFSELGQAAGMKAQEDAKMFQYNQLMPYERRMSMLGARSSGSNQLLNAGLQNVFGGLQGMGQAKMSMAQLGTGMPTEPQMSTRTREVRPSTYQVPLIPYQ